VQIYEVLLTVSAKVSQHDDIQQALYWCHAHVLSAEEAVNKRRMCAPSVRCSSIKRCLGAVWEPQQEEGHAVTVAGGGRCQLCRCFAVAVAGVSANCCQCSGDQFEGMSNIDLSVFSISRESSDDQKHMMLLQLLCSGIKLH
jgi:hypothetical protein